MSEQPSTGLASRSGFCVSDAPSERAILRALPDAVLLFDRDERLTGASDAFAAMFPGLDELLSEPVAADVLFAALTVHLAPAKEQGTAALLDERLRRMRELSPPWRQFLADGRIVEVEDRPLDGSGRLSVYRDVSRDVREFSLLSQRLAAFEAMGDGVMIISPQGLIDYANQSMAALLGVVEAESCFGKPWLGFLAVDSAALIETSVLPALANTRSWRGEVSSEAVPLEISINQLAEGGVIVVARSLVEQKAQAAELARVQAQFFGAQKRETLGTLAGGIAHDFNNILASMMGYATFLVEDLPADGAPADYAQHILTAGDRAKALVARILAFSRNSTDAGEQFAPAEVLGETVLFLESMLPPSVRLSLAVEDDSAVCRGSATQLGQVVMNLAVNARDALPKSGGTIDMGLSVGALPVPSPEDKFIISPHGVKDGQQFVCITVTDSGEGMSAETLDHVFEPFFTTKGDRGGTGLGLAAVKGIIAEQSGGLSVRSAPGEGTRFTLLLPLIG